MQICSHGTLWSQGPHKRVWHLTWELSDELNKVVRPGLDAEFHMRRMKSQFKSLRIKKCGIWFRRRISHVPNRIRERRKRSDGIIKLSFSPPDGKCVMKIVWARLTQRTVNILINWNNLFASSPGSFAFYSFKSHRIDLDITFHMYRIELFDSTHVNFGA